MEQLEAFTRRGDRVLAVAWKSLDGMSLVRIHRVQREELDCDLSFVGFVVMENRLKADTTKVLAELRKAEIRMVMVTGDNIQTAISVSRNNFTAEFSKLTSYEHVSIFFFIFFS